MISKIKQAGLVAGVAATPLLVTTSAFAQTTETTSTSTVPTVSGPDYSGAAQQGLDSGVDAFNGNILYALAIPALWVGYKVVRRVMAKVG